MTNNNIRHFCSIFDINRSELEQLFLKAEYFESHSENSSPAHFQAKKLGIMFFQNSTRTRLSFECAMQNLGGKILGFADPTWTRSGDFFQESLSDVVQVMSKLCDVIVLRHYIKDAAKLAAQVATVPIINAGDGGNEHPTQTLVDLWSIKRYLGRIDNLTFGIMGVLTTRTIRSLVMGLSLFKISKIIFLQPPTTSIPDDLAVLLKQAKISYEFYNDITEVLKDVDVLVMFPVKLPNFNTHEHEKTCADLPPTPDNFVLTKAKFLSVGRNVPILHCGPRLDELNPDTDTLPQSLYFQMVKNSIYIRMALLEHLLVKAKSYNREPILNREISLSI